MTSRWDQAHLAEDVDAYWGLAHEARFRQQIAHEIGDQLAPGSVVEAGCGSGRIYGALQTAGVLRDRDYTGFDSSRQMLRLAQRRYPDGDFRYGNLFTWDVAADNVLCVQVLQHVEDWQAALTRLLEHSRRLCYLVTWFGDGNRERDPGTGILNQWLKGDQLLALCARYGAVTRGQISDGTIGSLWVRRP